MVYVVTNYKRAIAKCVNLLNLGSTGIERPVELFMRLFALDEKTMFTVSMNIGITAKNLG